MEKGIGWKSEIGFLLISLRFLLKLINKINFSVSFDEINYDKYQYLVKNIYKEASVDLHF